MVAIRKNDYAYPEAAKETANDAFAEVAQNGDWRYSEAAYLALEAASGFKHEYMRGEIYAMAGASLNHNRIVTALSGLLYNRLGDNCEHFSSDMKVRVEATATNTYPDMVVVCDEPQFMPERPDTLTNPTVLFEVLSPSTADYDRGRKFEDYRLLPSLKEYVIVAQDKMHIEHYTRQDDGSWLLRDINAADATLSLATIGCELPIADIYAKVAFATAQPQENTNR